MSSFYQNSDGLVIMEAQSGISVSGDLYYWREQSVPAGASDSSCLSPTGSTWDKTAAGTLTYNFAIDTAGDYEILMRVHTLGGEGKVWTEIDGQRNIVGPGNVGRLYYQCNSWVWSNAHDNTDITLTAGNHTLKLTSLTSVLHIDRIAIVPKGSAVLSDDDTAIGPNETITGSIVAPDTGYNYRDWTLDVTREPHRVLLVELDHSGGTVRVASQPWLSDSHEPYDDHIINAPDVEESLSSFIGVGDLDLINPDLTVNWLDYNWRGYECRWYFGDITWPKEKFRRIATAMINECRVTSGRVYRFDLIDAGQKLNRTFVDIDTEHADTLINAVNWISSQADLGPIDLIGVPVERYSWPVKLALSESSRAVDVLRDLASSVGAYVRISQLGAIEIIVPDSTDGPVVTFTEDDIADRSVSVVDLDPAYKKIKINYADDGMVEGVTAAATGDLSETISIDTVLVNQGNSEEILSDNQDKYASSRIVWELKVSDISGLSQVGDYIAIEHEELSGNGFISSIKRSSLFRFSTVEVTL